MSPIFAPLPQKFMLPSTGLFMIFLAIRLAQSPPLTPPMTPSWSICKTLSTCTVGGIHCNEVGISCNGINVVVHILGNGSIVIHLTGYRHDAMSFIPLQEIGQSLEFFQRNKLRQWMIEHEKYNNGTCKLLTLN